jgi:hypothetical protein
VLVENAWLIIILGPVLSLVYGSVALLLLVKVNGYIISFDVPADFANAVRSMLDIQKILGRIVRRLLLGAFPWSCQLPMG